MTDRIDFSRYKIAIVDSDNIFCQQLKASLEDEGFRVEFDRNVHAGLKRIQRWRPHIVVSDFILHSMDYFDFAAEVEEIPTRVRMIVVSSIHLDGPLLTQLTGLSRVSLAVQKPIKPQELVEKIKELIPDIEEVQELIIPETTEPKPDYGLNNLELEREVARLQFEGKELPRFVKSLEALTGLAHEQPHKKEYLHEAIEQSKRSLEAVKRQRLEHLAESFEKITGWLTEIMNQGSHPGLDMWDYIKAELEELSEPAKKRVGTATLAVEQRQEEEISEETGDFPLMSPTFSAPGLSPSNLASPNLAASTLPGVFGADSLAPSTPHQQAETTRPGPQRTGSSVNRLRAMRFLVLGEAPRDAFLNLGSRYGVTVTFEQSPESVATYGASESFDLAILYLPAALSGERARESVVAAHEELRKLDGCKTTALVIVSETESLHTRIVAAHQSNTHWVSWSALRKSDQQFCQLKELAGLPELRPSVLIVDSDISDSEELLRELSRHCSQVDAVHDPDSVMKLLEETGPDIILISEQSGQLSGLDLCRAIRSSLMFQGATLVLEVATVDENKLRGAYRAGLDGIISKSDTIESRAETMLSIYRRSILSGMLRQGSGAFELGVSQPVRESLERDLRLAVEGQLPLTLCLLDLEDKDEFSRQWSSIPKSAFDSRASQSLHWLAPGHLLLSVAGMRRTPLEDLIRKLMEESGTGVLSARYRSYPDDALSLQELLRFS
ncbi:MAG: response regulator [Candidatus Obscuribacterales bacterium]